MAEEREEDFLDDVFAVMRADAERNRIAKEPAAKFVEEKNDLVFNFDCGQRRAGEALTAPSSDGSIDGFVRQVGHSSSGPKPGFYSLAETVLSMHFFRIAKESAPKK